MGEESPGPLLTVHEPVRIRRATSLDGEKSDCSGHSVRPHALGLTQVSQGKCVFGRIFPSCQEVYWRLAVHLRIVGGGLVGPDAESNMSSSPSGLLEMHWRLCDALLALCIFEESFQRSEWVG